MIERKLGKIITYKLSPDEGDEALYYLTFRQARALLSTLDYFRWLGRHRDLPEDLSTQAALNEWTDDLEKRLMKEYEDPSMDCEFIEDCIISSIDNPESPLYDKIRDRLAQDKDFLDKVVNGLVPFTQEQVNDGDESLNELWAQCTQIVEFTDDRIRALLSDIEVQSNNLEIMAFIEAFPVIGTIVDESQLDVAIDFVNYGQEIWAEQYDANYTTDPPPSIGTKWRLACALFCACKADKVITVDRIIGAFSSLVVGVDISLDSVGEIIQTLIGVNDNNEQVAYVSFTAMWGIAKLVSWLGGKRINERILSSILKLARNDANDDWATYCEDCGVDTKWVKYLLPLEPADTNKGTFSDDGNGTVVFEAGFSYGAYRIGWTFLTEADTQACYRILSIDGYDGVEFPFQRTCEGADYEVAPTEGNCYQVMVGARLSPFTVTVIYEYCG
jgi:hypothetical protein